MMSKRTIPLRLLSRHLVAVALDLFLSGVAIYAAYLTAYGYPRVNYVPNLGAKFIGFGAATLLTYVIFKPYRGSWRYVSLPDLKSIAVASFFTMVLYTVGMFLLSRGEGFPRSVVVLGFIYMVIGLVGARLAYRMFVERVIHFPSLWGGVKREMTPVLLYGFSGSAESFIRSTRRDGNNKFAIVGIIDDTDRNVGRTIQGIKVLGQLSALEGIRSKLSNRGIDVSELIVTQPRLDKEHLAKVVEMATALAIKVSRLPDPSGMASLTSNSLMQPRPIELGDLLERPEVNTDVAGVASMIEGKVVLATGAGGSIGSELSRQIATFQPRRLIVTDNSEFHLYTLDKELRQQHPDIDIVTRVVDVRDRSRVATTFAEFQPDVVFHAAALKHVPLMEENPLEAVKTNILGTKNVADAAVATKVSIFVLISTDKAVNPTNIMGATKRSAEAYCQSLDVTTETTRFKTVRFGNVLGSNGSVVPRFEEQIAAGGPVTVTHPDIVRFFMTIPEAVRLVLQASAHAIGHLDERGKIMVLDMGKPVRIANLAERMIQLAGFRPRIDIDIVFTGLRPGEKLYEELFDPNEIAEKRTDEGYVVASPRVIDRPLVERTLEELKACAEREDLERTLELLHHIVPEYRRLDPTEQPMSSTNVSEL